MPNFARVSGGACAALLATLLTAGTTCCVQREEVKPKVLPVRPQEFFCQLGL